MGFFQGLGAKLSGAANFIGRKIGAASQYVGGKVAKIANGIADYVDAVPGASMISGALRGVGGIGDSIVNGGKALVGGHGGLMGAARAVEDGLGKAENVGRSMFPKPEIPLVPSVPGLAFH